MFTTCTPQLAQHGGGHRQLQHRVVRGDEAVLVAAVQVHPVGVEEQAELYEEQVHVDGEQDRQQQQRGRPEQLKYRIEVKTEKKGLGETKLQKFEMIQSDQTYKIISI